ncbi:hypothetical protein KUH32_00185 [Thalassococcus sp. CAU 1522]|uniref:DUF1302 domain-containing protein n=1 Tax=Thalassococcus arenae TaxID=2851652 RepID=A0ABS6N3L1_9RHOB|nr:hypothetical protein [Thalassococcus arenae]MBV2358179.1 hypothetical protein [Thalassococcus arenae]
MKRLLTHSVAATLAFQLAVPAMAQDFDLPPDLPGLPGETVLPQDDVALAPGASEDPSAAADTGPVLSEGDADLELPPDTAVPVLAEAPSVAQVQPAGIAGNGLSATLELESRVFANTDLDGDTDTALRFQAHYFGNWAIGEKTSLNFNLRARTEIAEGRDYDFGDDFAIDIQELYLSYAVTPGTSLQFGRINIRNGVATGFNPTDWFRDDSLVLTGSAAPADRRNERLGVLALTATTTIGQTLVQLGYRPEIDADPDTVWTDADVFGMGLDRTNPSEAWFLKMTPRINDNLSFTANAVLIDDDPGLGFELSGTLGDNLVLYGEAMAQKRLSLVDEALGDTLGSAAFRDGVGAGQGKEWYLQAALGLNWALPERLVGAEDISITLEYHLNEAGLSNGQIAALSGATGLDGLAASAIYGVANRRQDPLAREQVFTRIAWNDAVQDADLSLLAFYVPADHSGLAQLSLDIPVGQNGNFNLRAISTFGDDTSIYGANPNKSSVQMGFTYTF